MVQGQAVCSEVRRGAGQPAESCPCNRQNAPVDAPVDVRYPGYTFDAGERAELHLDPAEAHAMFWIDLAGLVAEHQVEMTTLAGSSMQLTVGVALAFR
jgi:hypothetical protein